MPQWLSMILLALIIISAISSTILRNWKITLISLVLEYLGMTILISISLPPSIAIINLLVGWMCCAVLAISCISVQYKETFSEKSLYSSLLFRVLAVALVGTIVAILTPRIQPLLTTSSVPPITLNACIVLIFFGLIQVAMTSEPFFTITGLLTLFLGFDAFYSIVEVSSLLTGLLAVVNLGFVLIGSYFLIKEKENITE
jgi:hypothetical protein